MDFILSGNSVNQKPRRIAETCSSLVIKSSWETLSQHQRLKLETHLNYSNMVSPVNDEQLNFTRKRSVRDPLSHRIIEKKRRDRMNNCLANLSSLLPSSYWKKSRGRIEKTEIIEMAITHMKYLQMQINLNRHSDTSNDDKKSDNSVDSFCFGYQECMAEIMHFLVEVEGFYPGENLCVKLLNHLKKHGEEMRKRCDFDKSGVVINNGSETSKKIEVSSTTTVKEDDNNVITSTHKSFTDNSDNFIPTGKAQQQQHLEENGIEESKTHDDSLVPRLYQCYQPENACSHSQEIYKYKTRIKRRFNAEFCKQTDGIQAN